MGTIGLFHHPPRIFYLLFLQSNHFGLFFDHDTISHPRSSLTQPQSWYEALPKPSFYMYKVRHPRSDFFVSPSPFHPSSSSCKKSSSQNTYSQTPNPHISIKIQDAVRPDVQGRCFPCSIHPGKAYLLPYTHTTAYICINHPRPKVAETCPPPALRREPRPLGIVIAMLHLAVNLHSPEVAVEEQAVVTRVVLVEGLGIKSSG
jgi:hypothetical protein